MLSDREILFGMLLPLAVALLIGAIGWWTRQRWLSPLAGGAGFLIGYANSLGSTGGFGVPRLPPSDGTDWLFWASLPAIALAIVDSAASSKAWLAVLSAWSGVVVWAIVHPLVPGMLTAASAIEIAAGAAILSVILTAVQRLAAERIGHGWTVLSLSIIVGATGVTVLSSNLRTVGVYGLGAAAALAPLSLFASKARAAQPIAILGTAILSGLLAGGHFYPDPGVGWIKLVVLLLCPLVVLIGLAVPTRKVWVRGLAATLAVAIVAAAVAGPAALAAKHAAETDPYGTTN